MSGTNEDERMRSRTIALSLWLALSIIGCQTAQEKAHKQEVQRILDRTITETQVQKVEVPTYVNLPDNLIKPCLVTHNKDRSVAEYIRVAIENTANAMACALQVDGIRKAQPDQKSLPQK